MPDHPLVSYRLEAEIAFITLSRPEKRNAMNPAMLAELSAVVDRAADEARVAVLAGDGAHFCAGLDLAEAVYRDPLESIGGSRSWHAVFQRINSGRIPYIAALHGGVIGGGLELASVAHLRVAEADAFFALPEGMRGIFVGGGGSVNLSRLIGVSRMTDLMLTGRVMTASEAAACALVNYVTPAGGALAKATELARAVLRNTAFSNYAIINGLRKIHDSGTDEGLFFESILATFVQSTPEAAARMLDFVEKRGARVAAPDGAA